MYFVRISLPVFLDGWNIYKIYIHFFLILYVQLLLKYQFVRQFVVHLNFDLPPRRLLLQILWFWFILLNFNTILNTAFLLGIGLCGNSTENISQTCLLLERLSYKLNLNRFSTKLYILCKITGKFILKSFCHSFLTIILIFHFKMNN